MSGHLDRLHRERDRALKRVSYCRQELSWAESYADGGTLYKLQRDLRLAEEDCGHAIAALETALAEQGLSL